MNHIKTLFNLLRETFNEWNEDKAPRLGAALSYYTAFSLAPLLIVIIAMAGFFFGQAAVTGRIQYEIQGLVGTQAAKAIQDMIANFYHPTAGLIATAIGLGTLLFGAAGLFGALQDALNTVWEVTPRPGQGLLPMVRHRLLSFTLVLGIGFLLLVSLLISAAISALTRLIPFPVPEQGLLLQLLNLVISFGVITLLFATIYKVLPDVYITWHDVWMGAVVTALLFSIGQLVLGLYLGRSGIASSYGAAGSFVVLLLWINYSAQILLFGAEFTQVYARHYGSRIQPSRNAIALSDTDRLRQGIPHAQMVNEMTAKQIASPEVRQAMAERQQPAPAAPPESHLSAVILGICAALATFLVGMLIGTDQRG